MSIIGIIVAVGVVFSILAAGIFLKVQRREDEGWSLSAAMSEVVGYNQDGSTRYVSSASRLIALMGFILIFWIYLRVGLAIIEDKSMGKYSLHDVRGYLWFGLCVFAPYFANQARAAIVSFGKGLPKDLPAEPK